MSSEATTHASHVLVPREATEARVRDVARAIGEELLKPAQPHNGKLDPVGAIVPAARAAWASVVAAAAPASPPSDAEFKNFHRMLCERFNYTHDERDWKRDQVSLMEWIAKRVASPPSDEKLREALRPFLEAAEPIIHDDKRWDQAEWGKRVNRLTVGDFRNLYAALGEKP